MQYLTIVLPDIKIVSNKDYVRILELLPYVFQAVAIKWPAPQAHNVVLLYTCFMIGNLTIIVVMVLIHFSE
jgi:hypothetical protein